jgi:hypothetical protein
LYSCIPVLLYFCISVLFVLFVYILKTWTPMPNSVTSGAYGSAGPLRERERKLLEGSNAKKGKVIKKGRRGAKATAAE